MSSIDLSVRAQSLTELADQLESINATADTADLPVEDMQRVFTAAFHLYSRLAEERGIGDPFTPTNGITATQVVTTALAILHAQNLEVFELALWQSWGGAPWKNQEAGA
ncbi:MAG: hypothetical protein JST25_10945 [Actinobacteria bacterium]|nr:hypothetical protein [Actinomycetota bacterium]